MFICLQIEILKFYRWFQSIFKALIISQAPSQISWLLRARLDDQSPQGPSLQGTLDLCHLINSSIPLQHSSIPLQHAPLEHHSIPLQHVDVSCPGACPSGRALCTAELQTSGMKMWRLPFLYYFASQLGHRKWAFVQSLYSSRSWDIGLKFRASEHNHHIRESLELSFCESRENMCVTCFLETPFLPSLVVFTRSIKSF